MRRVKTLLITMMMLFSNMLHAFEPVIYRVRKNETLSEIARQIKPGYVYGAGGSLETLLRLNPQIKNANLIYSGQIIYLSRAQKRIQATSDQQTLHVEAKSEDNDNIEVFQSALVFGNYGFTTLKATDRTTNATAQLFSRYDTTVGMGWKQAWSQDFESYFSFSIRNLDFMASTNKLKMLTDTNKTLSALGAGVIHNLSEKYLMQYSLNISQELFIQGLTNNIVKVDALPILGFRVEGRYQLYEQKKMSIGLSGTIAYLGVVDSGDYDVSSGMSFGTSGYLLFKNKQKSLRLSLGYIQRHQKTSILKITEDNIFANLQFSVPIFEEGL